MKKRLSLVLMLAMLVLAAVPAFADTWGSTDQTGWRTFISFEALLDFLNNLGLPWSG
jgi:hypothetical protein